MQPGTSTLNGQVPTTGLSVTEAAQVLGVSPNTVRARIKGGKLRAERAQRPQGEVIRVFLDSPDTSTGTSRHVRSEVPEPGTRLDVPVARQADQLAIALAPLVEAAVAPLRAELADTRTALETARQELGAALERIRTLEATSTQRPSEGPTAHDANEPTQTPAQSPQRVPWWAPWRHLTV